MSSIVALTVCNKMRLEVCLRLVGAGRVLKGLLNLEGWQTTIQHWQLRDLICCGTHEDEVFLVNQNATFRCNTHTDEVSTGIARKGGTARKGQVATWSCAYVKSRTIWLTTTKHCASRCSVKLQSAEPVCCR